MELTFIIQMYIIFYNSIAIFCLIDILSFIISIIQFLSMYSWEGIYNKKIVISNLSMSYRLFKVIKFLNLMTKTLSGESQRIKFYNTYNYKVNISYSQHEIKILLFEFFYIMLAIITNLYIFINFYFYFY